MPFCFRPAHAARDFHHFERKVVHQMTASKPGSPVPASEGADFIRACYRDLLRRSPDEDGLAAHLRALEKGTARERLYYEIRVSPEGCRVRVPVSGLSVGSVRAKDLLRQDGAPFVDAVYLALGAQLGNRMPMEGSDAPGVTSAADKPVVCEAIGKMTQAGLYPEEF